jgi:hypothetical protein
MANYGNEVNRWLHPANLLGALLLLLIAFPYVQLVPAETYTQPYPLMLSSLLFFVSMRQLWGLPFTDRAALIGLAIVGICAFLITCFPYADSQEYKYLLNYLSPLLVTVATLRYLKKNSASALRLLKFSIFIWIMIAIFQKFVDPNFATFMIGQWSEHTTDIIDSGRGVLGLAPEPTHHAFHILILATCLVLLDTSRRSRWLLLLCVVDAVILAASSSAILTIGVSGFIWALCYRQRWIFFAAIVVALGWALGASVDFFMGSDSRVTDLISAVLADPVNLISIDYSVNMRLGGMIAVIIDVFSNIFIPNGMSAQSWATTRESLLSNMPWLMDLSTVGPPSGIGLVLFQTGALGGLFLGLIFKRVLTTRVALQERILLIAMPLVFLGQYYISAPSFSLLYASALFRLRGPRADLRSVAQKQSLPELTNLQTEENRFS